MEKSEEKIWEAIKDEGYTHAITFLVKDLDKSQQKTMSFAEGDMNKLYDGIFSIMLENQKVYEFFSTITEEVREYKSHIN